MKGIPFASKKLALETAFAYSLLVAILARRSAWEVPHGPGDLQIICVVNVSVDTLLDCAPISRERRCNEFHIVCRLGRHLIDAVDVCEQDHRVWKKN
jgi:hypothetical protein